MNTPVTNALRRTDASAHTANTTHSASLCAPATTAQITRGFRTVNSTARACRTSSPPTIATSTAPMTSSGTIPKTWSHQTTSCIDSPPSTFANHWDAVASGP